MPTAKKEKKHSLRVIHSEESSQVKSQLVDKYRVLFEQASDAIMTVDAKGCIDETNRAFEDLSGYLKTELSGESVKILSPDPHLHHIPERTRPIHEEMLTNEGTYEDVAILRNDSYVRLIDLSVRKARSGNSYFFIALMKDVTIKKQMERELITKHAELKNAYIELEKSTAEMKSMQESLVQAGKMAALGELAAGIAHELNQPLQGIRGYAQELESILNLEAISKKGEVNLSLREIVSNVDKMAKIISYLRSFTRKSTEEHEMTDVHEAIEEALKMLSRQFAARGISINKNFGKTVSTVYANPLQLEQVFINLATNARDAIEATGRGEGQIIIETRNNDKFVEITFRDDGVGMNERTKSKIFNPFFTTKEVGKGMGLGLSISYGILNKINGNMMVNSELGKGTEFTVRIPKDFREA